MCSRRPMKSTQASIYKSSNISKAKLIFHVDHILTTIESSLNITVGSTQLEWRSRISNRRAFQDTDKVKGKSKVKGKGKGKGSQSVAGASGGSVGENVGRGRQLVSVEPESTQWAPSNVTEVDEIGRVYGLPSPPCGADLSRRCHSF